MAEPAAPQITITPWARTIAGLIFDAPQPGEGRAPAIERVSAIIAEHCASNSRMLLLQAAVHCEWLDAHDRMKLAQELASAADMPACEAVLAWWQISFADGALVDASGEVSHV